MALQGRRVEYLCTQYSKCCRTFDSIERLDDGDYDGEMGQQHIVQMRQIDCAALLKLSEAMFVSRLPYLASSDSLSSSYPRLFPIAQVYRNCFGIKIFLPLERKNDDKKGLDQPIEAVETALVIDLMIRGVVNAMIGKGIRVVEKRPWVEIIFLVLF